MLRLGRRVLRRTRGAAVRRFAGGPASGPDGRAAESARGGGAAGEREPDGGSGSSDGSSNGKSGGRMSMKEIQALHAAKASAPLDPAKRAKISTGKVFRGSDGFLDFEEVPPPWKGREGPYKPIYLLYDANWVLRKSKKADRILGGISVAFVCGAWGVYTWAPHLML